MEILEYLRDGTPLFDSFPNEWNEKGESEKIDLNSKEGKEIQSQLHASFPKAKITQIIKIMNKSLWKKYKVNEKLLQLNIPTQGQDLFHSEKSKNPETIWKGERQGFISTPGIYGEGTYFYEKLDDVDNHAYISNPKTDERVVLLCKVLTGETYISSKEERSLRLPPLITNSTNLDDRFDSVCGNSEKGRIYVIYESNRAYPIFQISYTI